MPTLGRGGACPARFTQTQPDLPFWGFQNVNKRKLSKEGHFVFRISYFVFRISYFVFRISYFVFRILHFAFRICILHFVFPYPNLRTQILEVAGFPKCIVCPSDRKVIVSSYSRFKTSTLVEGRNFNPSKNSKNCPSFS